ncbi:hypothetical protein [Sphingomonas cynarae]
MQRRSMARTAKRKAKRKRDRTRRLSIIALLLLWLGGVMLLWPAPIDRLIHPARFATTGRALLPPGAYPAAARARLRPDDRIGELILPRDGGPVIVVAGASRVWLDPPTARVLAVDRGDPVDDTVNVEPAQGVATVVMRAQAVARGKVSHVVWPGAGPGQPDWLVTLTDHGRETIVKVADDTTRGGAAIARAGRWQGRGVDDALRWLLLAAPVVPIAIIGWRWGRRRSAKPVRRR